MNSNFSDFSINRFFFIISGIINDYRSPFQSVAWLIFVIVWSVTSVVFVTVNFLTSTLDQPPNHLGIQLSH